MLVGFTTALPGATSLRRGPANTKFAAQSSRATTLLTATRPSCSPQTLCNHIACCCLTRRRPPQPRLPSWILFQALLIPTCFIYINRSLRPCSATTNASLKHNCRQMCCTKHFDRPGKHICRSATVHPLTQVLAGHSGYQQLRKTGARGQDRPERHQQ